MTDHNHGGPELPMLNEARYGDPSRTGETEQTVISALLGAVAAGCVECQTAHIHRIGQDPILTCHIHALSYGSMAAVGEALGIGAPPIHVFTQNSHPLSTALWAAVADSDFRAARIAAETTTLADRVEAVQCATTMWSAALFTEENR